MPCNTLQQKKRRDCIFSSFFSELMKKKFLLLPTEYQYFTSKILGWKKICLRFADFLSYCSYKIKKDLYSKTQKLKNYGIIRNRNLRPSRNPRWLRANHRWACRDSGRDCRTRSRTCLCLGRCRNGERKPFKLLGFNPWQNNLFSLNL